ncbi:hypothetical protein D5086_014383 [Populus alba]|uniref:Uncharacterized protein n=1 Tax=Populus alba TaxID=43335 RepID=A0ACC4BXX5_POPAL
MWVQGAELKQPLKPPFLCNPLNSNRTRFFTKHYQKQKPFVVVMSMSTKSTAVPIMVNGCNGKMGSSVIMAANSAGLQILPKSFGPVKQQSEESHQAAKLDTSATAKAVISCFKKLGVSFDDQVALKLFTFHYSITYPYIHWKILKSTLHLPCSSCLHSTPLFRFELLVNLAVFLSQIEMIWDPKEQKELVGVPDEYLSGHAFHFYYLSSPGKTVSLEFQHNVCGRSIYAEGTIDAVLFLAEKRIDRMLRWILLNLNGTAVVAKGERESRVALPSMQENLSNKGVKNELEWPFFCNVPLGL